MKLEIRNRETTRVLAICAVLVALVLIVFGQTVRDDFINYDDPECVYENPVVSKGLSVQAVGWAFTHSQLGHWDPLATLSHMADCQLYGLLWPGGHHLTNVLLQAASAVLLFLLFLQLTGAMWRSAFLAAFWAIHPLRVESVAWVAERKDVLSGVFFMLTLMAYGWYARRPGSWRRYTIVAVSFALGLMSKSMLVTLPLVLLLLDYWPLKRFAAAPGESNLRVVRRLLLEKLPLLLISILFAVVQMNADRVGIVSFRDLPFTQRAGNAVVSYVVYLGQTVRPVNLGVFYPHPRGTLPVRDVLFAMLILVLLSAAAISARKRQPWLIVGWLWYLIMLAPVIGIVQSGYLARADRYTYLPQIGLCIAGVWTVADYAGRRGRHRLWATGSIAALALCVLMVAAFCQTTFWLNSVTLWSHTLKCAVDNTLTRNALGLALLQQGRTEEAIAQYRQALRINPGFPKTYCDLANALLQQGQIGEAIEAMEKAIALQPANQEIKNQLAWTLATAPEASLRNGPRAVELALQASQAARGNDPNILRTLAAAYAQAGMYPDAVRTAQSALQLAKNGELAGMLSRDIKLYQTARALPNGP